MISGFPHSGKVRVKPGVLWAVREIRVKSGILEHQSGKIFVSVKKIVFVMQKQLFHDLKLQNFASDGPDATGMTKSDPDPDTGFFKIRPDTRIYRIFQNMQKYSQKT